MVQPLVACYWLLVTGCSSLCTLLSNYLCCCAVNHGKRPNYLFYGIQSGTNGANHTHQPYIQPLSMRGMQIRPRRNRYGPRNISDVVDRPVGSRLKPIVSPQRDACFDIIVQLMPRIDGQWSPRDANLIVTQWNDIIHRPGIAHDARLNHEPKAMIACHIVWASVICTAQNLALRQHN